MNLNEEDIKFIKYYINEYVAVDDIGIEDDFKFQEAIENLIKRNKELEEENEGLQNQANNLVEEYEKEIAEKNEKIFGLENVCVSLHKLIDEEM